MGELQRARHRRGVSATDRIGASGWARARRAAFTHHDPASLVQPDYGGQTISSVPVTAGTETTIPVSR
jgi:hypothetical protein